MTDFNRTFCISDNCINDCGRQLTNKQIDALYQLGITASFNYFCGGPTVHLTELSLEEFKKVYSDIEEK